MKQKKWYLLLIMMLLGALLLTACGGGNTVEESAQEAAEQVEEAAEETAAEAEEAVEEVVEEAEATAEEVEETMEEEEAATQDEEAEATAEASAEEEAAEEEAAPEVSLKIWADDTRAPILGDLAEEFQTEYGVGLEIEQVGFGDIRDQMKIAGPAGEGPDIFIGAHDWLGELVASGLLAPIDLGDKADNFTEVSLLGCTFEGELYCMPYAVENLAFFRNTDLVPEAPATWEEVAEIGQTLIDEGTTEQVIGLSGTTYDAFPLQTAYGGYIFGRNEEGSYDPADVGVDSEGMIAAGQWLDTLVEEGALSENVDWDTAHVLFEEGQVPFIMAGPWALDRIRESGVPYAISTFPAGDDGEGQPFLGVQGFFVNALSENALLAQVFLTEFVATDETMQALFEAGQRPPAWIPALEAVDDPDFVAFGEAGADGVPMPAIPEMSAVWASWGDAFTLILQQEQEPTDALTTAGEQIRSLIAGEE